MQIRNLLLFIIFAVWFSGCSTPLNEAIDKGDLEHISSIVSKDRSKIYERDESGNTILHNAVREDNIDIVKYLLSQDIDIDIKNSNDETALAIAIDADNEKLTFAPLDTKYFVNFSVNKTSQYRLSSPHHQ